MSESEGINQKVAELAERFIQECQDGVEPSIETYALENPDIADQIRSLFPAMEIVEELGPISKCQSAISNRDVEPHSGLRDCIPEPVPSKLGDFEIVGELGRGGMGIVYRAQQRSLRRVVALKILPLQPSCDVAATQRFQIEAQSAARLHHRHIVPVFEVGEANGYSYYAMQLIEGQSLEIVIRELQRMQGEFRNSASNQTSSSQSLTRILNRISRANKSNAPRAKGANVVKAHAEDLKQVNEHKISPQTQVADPTGGSADTQEESNCSTGQHGKLLSNSAATKSRSHFYKSVASIGLQVARGLSYAHEQEILHRDIKPSNLLIDENLNAWITDFGLAKPTGTELTNSGDVVGTINYMAPERFHGWADPRSDVYSLGITLYELLTLRTAYESKDRFALIRSISSDDPPRTHSYERRRPTDLDTIIHKAIQREPADRYSSAKEMADDLERFLSAKPIMARRSGRLEQISRMCRRSPWTTALAITLILSLVAGIVTATFLWREEANQRSIAEANEAVADEQRRVAWQAVDDYFTRVSQQRLLEIPGAEPLRRELLLLAVQYYERFVGEHSGDARLQRELANTHLRLGQLYRLVDSRERAQEEFEKALVLARRNCEAFSGRPSDIAVAKVLNELGYVEFERGELELALVRFDEAIALMETHFGKDSQELELVRLYADIVTNRASSLQYQSTQDAERNRLFEKAVQLRVRQYQISKLPECQLDLVASYNNLIASLVTSGELEKAMRLADESTLQRIDAEQTGRALPRDEELHGDAMHNLAVLAHRRGMLSTAVTRYENALQTRVRLHAWHPNNHEYRRNIALTGSNLVGLYREVGRVESAIDVGLETLAHLQWLVDHDPEATAHQGRLVQIHFRLTNLYEASGQIEKAIVLLDAIISILDDKDLRKELSIDEFARSCQAKARRIRLENAIHSNSHIEQEVHQLLVAIQSGNSERNKSKVLLDVQFELNLSLAEISLSRGGLEEARAYVESAKEIAEQFQNSELSDAASTDYQAQCLFTEGLIDLRAKEWESAEHVFAEAIDIWQELRDVHPNVVAYTRRVAKSKRDIASSHLGQGDVSTAISELQESIELFEDLRVVAPAQVSHHVDFIEALHQLGYAHSIQREYGESRLAAERSVAAIRELPQRLRHSRKMKRNLAMNLTLLGAALLAQGNAEDAYQSFDQAELAYRDLLSDDSHSVSLATHLGGARCNAALALRRLSRNEEALAQYALASESLNSLHAEGIASLETIEFLEKSLTGRAELLMELERPQQALPHLDQSHKLLTQLRAARPSNPLYERRIARVERLVDQAKDSSSR